MCGRFTLTISSEDLARAFPEFRVPGGIRPRYNIAPAQDVAVVSNAGSGGVEFFRWGLVPSWSKDPRAGNRLINARAETLTQRPSFRASLHRRRCVVLADGFYEWETSPAGKGKHPHLIRLKGNRPFVFAGLWDLWKPPVGNGLRTCTIITVPANETVAAVHDRMPAILAPGNLTTWLAPEPGEPLSLLPLLRPFPAAAMEMFPVSRAVNSPANDSPACIVPTTA